MQSTTNFAAAECLYYVTGIGKVIATTVTSSPIDIKHWIDKVKGDEDTIYCRHVAFGVVIGNDNVSIETVYFCVGLRCLVLQRFREMRTCPAALLSFITNKKFVFVSVNILGKLAQFQNQSKISVNVNHLDLGQAASRRFRNEQLRFGDFEMLVSMVLDLSPLSILPDDEFQKGCLEAFLYMEMAESLTTFEGLICSALRRENRIKACNTSVRNSRLQLCYTVHVLCHEISTTVTWDKGVVADWIHVVNSNGIQRLRQVGIEVEFDNNHIATLQLLVEGKCLIYRVFNESCPELDAFLIDDRNVFVGSGVDFLLDSLSENDQITTEGDIRYIDIGANSTEVKDKKLELLLALALPGVDCDWGRRNNLSHQQVHFACVDCFLNLQIMNWLWK